MGREAPLNSHNFNVWSNFKIPVGGDKIIVLKFKIVTKAQRELQKIFDAYRRKASKVVPYKMGSGAALGASRVLVGRH